MKTKRVNVNCCCFPVGGAPAAFTRLELLACTVCLALVCAVALPGLGTTHSQSDTAQCLNNLRRIGIAVQSWGTEHQYDPPWRTRVSNGGTLPDAGSKFGNAWFEFTYLSNQLVTPRILVCPADEGARMAADFSGNPSRGYAAPGFRALATSYCINLHTLSSQPATIVCADRNIRFSGLGNCAYVSANAWSYSPFSPAAGVWTNAVHGLQGNILLMDGSVMEVTSTQADAALRKSDENGTVHLLTAR